jgi:hypothetical protein
MSAGLGAILRKLRQLELPAVKEALGVAALVMSFRAVLRLGGLRLGVLSQESTPRAHADLDDLHQRVTAADSALPLQHSPELFAWIQERVGHELVMIYSYDADALCAYLFVLAKAGSNVAELVDFCAASPSSLLAALAALRDRPHSTSAGSLFVAVNT